MGHTPGPWRIGAGGQDDGKRNLCPTTPMRVVEVQTNHRHGYWSSIWCVNPEDARLIAAAPDLLEACKAALENLSECDGRQRQWACEQIEAAIAKATLATDAG